MYKMIISTLILWLAPLIANAQTFNFNITCDSAACLAKVEQAVALLGEACAAESPPPENNEAAVYSPQAGDLLINEFVSNPVSGEKEWVEIYNTLAREVDLTGWKLKEGAGQVTNLSGSLAAGGYAAFERSSLNNDGDAIFLIAPNGLLVSEVQYGGWSGAVAVAPAKGNSIALINGAYLETTTPTRGEQNILNAPETEEAEEEEQNEEVDDLSAAEQEKQTEQNEPAAGMDYDAQISQFVVISEICADPAGSDENEWIELYNGAEIDLPLAGWYLDDADGGSWPYQFAANDVIASRGYLVMPKSQTKLSLNNTGDSVRLLDKNKNETLAFAYPKAKEAYAWALFGDEWQETPALTPGGDNVFPQEEDDDSLAIQGLGQTSASESVIVAAEDAADLPVASKVKVYGQVAALPGVFGKRQMYLNGLQIYFYQAAWPPMQIGERLEISGEIAESQGERRLKIKNASDIVNIGTGDLEPEAIGALEIGETASGRLVALEGELSDKQKSKLYFAADDGEFIAYLKTGAQIKTGDMQIGERYAIAGVVAPVGGEYYVVPREQSDLSKLESSPIVETSAAASLLVAGDTDQWKTLMVLLAVAVLFIGANVYLHLKKRRQEVNEAS